MEPTLQGNSFRVGPIFPGEFGMNKKLAFFLVLACFTASCNLLSEVSTSQESPTVVAQVALTTLPTLRVTPTALHIETDSNESKCVRPDRLQSFKVAVVGNPSFCVVWVDRFENEVGFRVVFEYLNSDEVFVYELGSNATQLVMPNHHVPRPAESREQCIARKDFTVQVSALLPNVAVDIGTTSGQSECNFVVLPTATSATLTPGP
jgi:hypothetical protein